MNQEINMSHSIPSSTLEKFTTFGDLLRFLRRRAGITQMELATAVGYSDAQISRLEQNLRLPDIPTIQARFVPALDLEDEPKAVARLLELAANVRREDAPGLGICPYKGLSYFDETDADLFAGREVLTARLVEKVVSMSQHAYPGQVRFQAIVGASGSGKSSLVRAGLVPGLRWNKASTDWDIHVLTPTAHPLESLAVSLAQENSSLASAAALIDDLSSDSRSLHLFASRQAKSMNSPRLLLIIDQFEELFALCRSDEERVIFIDNLLRAASAAGGSTMVIITLRADFYTHCAEYESLRLALAQQQEYIGAMNAAELRRAIEEPARRGRWELEPGLVDLLLHDVGQEPGALPLLSHALMETWQRRRGRAMTLSGYTSSGGVRGAIAETAEAVFTDQLTPQQRIVARRIFLRLTELGEETATGDTRRRASFEELIVNPAEKAATEAVIKALADARLIITSQDSAEVAHEALIREWPTLRGWLEENRDSLRLHRRLTEAAQDWAARNREADVLYRGARLAQACEWSALHQGDLNPLESEFLSASQSLADCEVSEREAQRQRELEAAQKLAEIEHQRAEEQEQTAKLLQKRSFYLAGAFLLAVLLLFAAGYLGWQARIASAAAASRELAAAALSNLDIDPERSVLLAMEAISKTYTVEAEDALHQSILASRIQHTVSVEEPGAPISVAYSPDGTHLSAASPNEEVKVWDASDVELLFTVAGHSVNYSTDGKKFATVISDGTVKVWDASTGGEIPLSGQISAGEEAVFSPDGEHLATTTSVNLPRIWDLRTGQELLNFPGHSDYVSHAFFSPDGKKLLTTSDDGTARLWDTTTGVEMHILGDHPAWVWSAAFSPDGRRIATISGNQAMIWDAITGDKITTLTGHTNTLYAVAFSPDGSQLATGGQDRKIKIWDTSTGKELFTLAGHAGAVSGVAFNPDGAQLASGSDDGTVRIWDLAPGGEWPLVDDSTETSRKVAFSPDGDSLASANDRTVQTWDVKTGQKSRLLAGYKRYLNTFAYHPDGKRLATAGEDAVVRLWDLTTGEERYNWSAHPTRVTALAFSPDGSHLATAGDDYKVKIWVINSGEDASVPIAQLSSSLDFPTEIVSLAFNPDGTRLAIGFQKGITSIWNLASTRDLVTFQGHTDDVSAISFSPDGKQVATASLDGTAKVWDATDGEELWTLGSHNADVTSVAYSPDGKRIASASRDGTVKVWDVLTKQEILTLTGDRSGINSLAFNRDGNRLAVGGDAGVRIYLLSSQDLVTLAHSRVTRPLSTDECQKYLHRVSAACAQPEKAPTATPWPVSDQGRICQVTNTGGLNDNYFNALLHKGILAAAREHGWEATTLQSTSISDYQKNIDALLDADCRLIVVPGNLVETAQAAAEAKPEQKFLVTDFLLDPSPGNVWTQVYATDQAAFLAGYVAASVTKTGKVGLFGGVDIPQVTGFMDGFALGVSYYNEKNDRDVQVVGWDPQKHVGLFVGGFCCTTEGRKMAKTLIDEGADVILPVAGNNIGWGAGQEAKAHGKVLFVGVDTDWTLTAPEFSEIVLTSIEKRFDASVIQAAKSFVEGTFSGGIHTGSLATGEVGISPFHALDGLVPDQVKADLEHIKADIISGKIKTRPDS
jgi:WD40 repeat protein/basic membrane lipoprotein Med (substrate-binding protein (PBP1-ABC) superfamily)